MSCPPDRWVQGCWEYMIQISKNSLRKEIQIKRNCLLKSEVITLSELINQRLKKEVFFNDSDNIAFYMAFDNEPNLSLPINKNIFLPKIDNEKLTFHLYTDKFKKNKFGIKEPVDKKVFPINKIQLILIPLIAFNTNLFRIGYGGGFYDRTLQYLSEKKDRPRLWGVGYDFQKVSTNFQNKYDIRLDKVITDKKIYV
tara:strand:- start:3939 stop:4529 length:591 start_codon:yes stop_codon:yes gene_type:complete